MKQNKDLELFFDEAEEYCIGWNIEVEENEDKN